MGVLVVDDHPCVRMALSSIVESRTEIELLGEAASGDQALVLAERKRPSLIICDLEIRGFLRGTELLRMLKALPWRPQVIVFSGSRDSNEVVSALMSGADSFVHKGIAIPELLRAIERTLQGEKVLLLEGESAPKDALDHVHRKYFMTEREAEVLLLLLRRFSNEEIAEELTLARQTVKNHVSRVFRKVGVTNRRELRCAIGDTALTARGRYRQRSVRMAG
ncbi:response regulator transcription factor [Streptomyces spiramenti]